MTKISIIVAADENNAIGKGNQMLTHLPNDLKYFKEKTSTFPIIMGRKTFESLPKGALPNRRNIVISRDESLRLEGCEMTTSIDGALYLCKDEEQVFIIGGGMIYEQTLDMADIVYITRIHHKFEAAEVYFPELNMTQWRETSSEKHRADEKHEYDYSFLRFDKISS